MTHKLFTDKHGKQTFVQAPNYPLAVWLVSWALTHILPYGTWNFAANLVAFGSLFTWAWLELFQGDSYFRQALGLIVMVGLVHSRL